MSYDEAFDMGFKSYKKGMPYFCKVPDTIKAAESTPDKNLIIAYCNGYMAGYYKAS